ncbi:MAG TPA: peptidoglycan-associated lipoprotein Pal [Burkholderiaceae bacterium]|nr:peptidoglycan-associated lipoprotein Pal [Burkholderiaceae bacterium]
MQRQGMTALLVALGALTMAGCSSVKLDSDVPVETRTPTTVGSGSGAGTSGAGQSGVKSVDLAKDANAAAGKIVYFDFDSYVVKDEYRPLIDSYAKTLAADRKKHVVVEGHTDERGGREYNLALGQKRAEAVTKALALLGATDAQLEAVSYGKERPAAQGSDEAAWAKNRRAELVNR